MRECSISLWFEEESQAPEYGVTFRMKEGVAIDAYVFFLMHLLGVKMVYCVSWEIHGDGDHYGDEWYHVSSRELVWL